MGGGGGVNDFFFMKNPNLQNCFLFFLFLFSGRGGGGVGVGGLRGGARNCYKESKPKIIFFCGWGGGG